MFKPVSVIILAGVLLTAAQANAQQTDAADYPSRAVKIVVTVPAGGGVDTVTRMVAEHMRQQLGQPFVVENRAGASGNLGAETVYNAEPDGYTLMASQPAPLTINRFLYKKLTFDPTALEPVAVMSKIPNVLMVRNDFPAKTAQEFIAYAKANPGKLNYASQGTGTTSHLTAELFMARTGLKLVHIPYKGTAPALNDLIAGHVDLIFMELASAIRLHNGGKARILAVATDKRNPALPDIPTLEEAGVPNFESATWNAIAAPPKTPKPIIAKLNKAVNEALKSPELQDHFKKLSLTPAGGTPEDMAELIKADTKLWGDVVRAANIQTQ
ncbi:MAG TPA: tripartite tricarboxylate transporter substrate binding protein [Xanthobacteraceae bacterium]|nr:tripartite tricarboxylate transporter substrate binding protein [Xanthobacteraceae bacterium]